jgi:Tfp pilus assembly PilM family ATPase
MSPKKSTDWSTAKSKSRLGIWLTPHHLRLVWRQEGQVAGATWKPLHTNWMRGGEVLDPRHLGQVLGEALREVGYQGRGDVTWFLPPELMLLRVSEAPALEGEYLEKALLLEAERLPPERSDPSFPRLSLHPAPNGRRQAVLGKVFASTLNALQKITQEQGLRLWDLEQAGQAVAIRHASQQEVQGLWALLHLEPSNSSLVFFWNKELVRSRSLVDLLDPWIRQVKGEEGLLEVLVGGGRLQSEEVFGRITQAMEETLQRIIQDDLTTALTRAASEQALTRLYISGLGALEPGLRELLVESYYFEVVCLDDGLPDGAMYAPVAAALDGQRVSRFPLAGERKEWDRRLWPILAGSLGVVAIISLAGFFYSLSLGQQIAAVNTEIARLKPEEERHKALTTSIKALEGKVAALEALQPVDWSREMAPLLAGLPTNEGRLGVGLGRLGVLSDPQSYRYSLEGVAASQQALDEFLRYWENRTTRSVSLNRWDKKGGVYEFTASVSQRREVGDERSER